MRRYFFDVPVYRLAEGSYYAERTAHVEREMYPTANADAEQIREFHKREPAHYIAARDHVEKAYGGMWRYNEIIGYIRLYFFGSQVRGEYIGIKAQRIVRTRKKLFEHQTHKLVPELTVPNEATSADIFRLIKAHLVECQRELPNRYFDTTLLDKIGPYVDWRGLYIARDGERSDA